MTDISSGGIADPEVEPKTADDATFTMQDWLDGTSDFKTLRRGEVVEGSIMAIQRDGVLVDLGSKSEGIIPPHEMHSMGADPLSKVAVGETILVYVMQPEADQGQIMLSVWNRSSYAYTIQPLERIAQLVVVAVAQVSLNVVEHFEASERGDGGFGSTGS